MSGRAHDSTTPVRALTQMVPPPPRASAAPWIFTLVVIALAGSGGYWFFQEHQMVREALVDAEDEADRANRHVAQADARVMAVEAELSKVRGDFSVDKQKSRQARDALVGKLTEALGDRAALTRAGHGLQVEVSASRLFRGGRIALTEDGQILLQNLAAALNRFPDAAIWVRTRVRESAQWQRSTAQALAVVRYLEGESVESARLSIVTRAGDSADTPVGWRVELIVGQSQPTQL